MNITFTRGRYTLGGATHPTRDVGMVSSIKGMSLERHSIDIPLVPLHATVKGVLDERVAHARCCCDSFKNAPSLRHVVTQGLLPPVVVLGRGLDFTRYCFTSRLLRTNQSSVHCPLSPVLPALLQYYHTSIAQYTTPPTTSRVYAIAPYNIGNDNTV